MTDRTCRCSMVTRVLGDGCEFCNPRLAADLAVEQEADTVPLMRDALKGARDTLQALAADPRSLSRSKIRRQASRCARALRVDGDR